MKAGDEIKLTIERVAGDGSGAAQFADREVRVPGAAPGDVVTVRIAAVSRQNDRAFGVLTDVRSRGEAFRRPPCHHAAPLRGDCGGCAVQHVTPEAALDAKRALVTEALAGVASLTSVVPAPTELGYRNRTNYLAWRSGSGNVRLGSRKPRSGEFARMDGCLVVGDPIARIADLVAETADALRIPVIPEPEGLRGVSIRVGTSGRVLVELIAAPDAGQHTDVLARRLSDDPAVAGVSVSVHDGQGNAIRTDAPRPVVGDSTVDATVADVTVALSSDTFFQLNYAVADALFREVASRARSLAGGSDGPIWDLYCGVGTAGLAAGKATGRDVFGADAVTSSIDAARESARRAGITATFEVADLEREATASLAAWPTPSVIIVDPPRRGMPEGLTDQLAKVGAPVVYLSCNAHTFARDASRLVAHGWSVRDMELRDMLPQTPHTETIATLRPPES